jgi:hypothetical protein
MVTTASLARDMATGSTMEEKETNDAVVDKWFISCE